MNANNPNTWRSLDLILVEDSAIDAELSHELGRAPPFALDFADAPDEGGPP